MLFSTSIFSRFGFDLGGFWEPSWSQVGSKSRLRVYSVLLFRVLKLRSFYKWRFGGLWARFGRPWGSIWEGSGTIFSRCLVVFGTLPRRSASSTPSSAPSSDPSDVGRANPAKKLENLPRSRRVAGRLPRTPGLPSPRGVAARSSKKGGAAVIPPQGVFNRIRPILRVC